MKLRKDGLAHDEATEEAVLGIFGRHGLTSSILEPALRDDNFFGNVIGKWRVGSLVISLVSDRGQWFAAISTANARGQSLGMDNVASLLGLEPLSPDPPQSLHPVIELIADNFASIEVLFSEPHIQQTKRELEAIAMRRDEEIKSRLKAIATGAIAPSSQEPK